MSIPFTRLTHIVCIGVAFWTPRRNEYAGMCIQPPHAGQPPLCCVRFAITF